MALFSSSIETHRLQNLDSYLQEFDQMQDSSNQTEMAMAISHLKNEFCYLLSGYSIPSNIDDYTDWSCSSTPVHFRFSVSSNISEPDEAEIDDSRVHYLRCIAERLIAAGFAQDCIESYRRIRRQAMDARLMELEITVRNTGHVQILEQEMQARKINQWIRAARELINTIFANEKLIIHQIFNGLASDDVEETCFALTVKSSAQHLLDFAGEISVVPTQSAPERLFPALDLYEVLSELLPTIKIMFGGKYVYLGSIYKQAEHLLIKLADAAKGILSELEKSLLNETGCKGTQTGDVLPLTRYVMDFLKKMAVYRQPLTRMADCLNELIVSKPSGKNPRTPEMDTTEFEEETPLALHLIWIILILLSNLEGKSKHYKNVSLSHLFMMNNVYFIVKEITNSTDLRETMGGAYTKILTRKYRHSAMTYLRLTWAKVLHCLRQDQSLFVSISGNNNSLRVSKSALRERFKTFNAMFEEVHRIQTAWFVPCTHLRADLWISISEKLIPAYRTITGRFRDTIESDRHVENCVKYTVADLENAVLDLFEGRSVSQPLRRRVDADSIAS